jgi:hypothetical protein
MEINIKTGILIKITGSKVFYGGSFYETETDEYGITDGFTFTFLGNNFNFAKEIK